MSVSKLSEELNKSSQLKKSNLEVEVLTTTANGKTELSVNAGKTVKVDGVLVTYFRRLTKDHSHFSPQLLIALNKRINKSPNKPLIHIQAWWNFVSVLACALALFKKAPIILSPRGTLSNYSFNNRTSILKKLFHKFIGEPLLRRCHFHVTSEKEEMDILRLVRPKSITVIPNFVALPFDSRQSKVISRTSDFGARRLAISQLKEDEGRKVKVELKAEVNFSGTQGDCFFSSTFVCNKALSERDYIVPHNDQLPKHLYANSTKALPLLTPLTLKLLFLSRIEEKKGLDILFKALSNLDIPWTLSIAGDGKPEYISSLKDLLLTLNLNINLITWLGHQNPEQKFQVLADHDLLVLPSHDENFANVVIESLAMGTPVLISKNVGLADYVSKNNLGWICDTDIDSVASKLEEAYGNPDKLKSISMSSSKKVKNDFNEDILVRKYLNLYSSVAHA